MGIFGPVLLFDPPDAGDGKRAAGSGGYAGQGEGDPSRFVYNPLQEGPHLVKGCLVRRVSLHVLHFQRERSIDRVAEQIMGGFAGALPAVWLAGFWLCPSVVFPAGREQCRDEKQDPQMVSHRHVLTGKGTVPHVILTNPFISYLCPDG